MTGRLRIRRLAIAATVAIAAVFGPLSARSAGDESGQFLQRFDAFRSAAPAKTVDWLAPASPWAPFLGRQFAEGLRADDQARHLTLQEGGACGALAALEREGAARLYPGLAPALDREDVSRVFESAILPRQSFGYRRCRAHARLRPLIREARRKGDAFYAMYLPAPVIGGRLSRFADADKVTLSEALEELVRLAVCDDYGPAFGDLARFNREHLLILSAGEHYYVHRRARQLGLQDATTQPPRSQALNSDESVRLAKLRAAFDAGQRDRARALVRSSRGLCESAAADRPR